MSINPGALMLLASALGHSADAVPYGMKRRRNRSHEEPPQKVKATKVMCACCRNTFKSKHKVNRCNKCGHSGELIPNGNGRF